MPGGLIQLAVYGAQDYYLTSNPQISFFKSVYRRYTNFSMEMINLVPTLSNKLLDPTQQLQITFTINRQGDLFKDIYFIFELPDIYSDGATQFQWINRIGEYIISRVDFNLGNRKIDTQYGEWMHIWSEISLEESKIDGYNRMIANVPEVYDPTVANGGTYPVATSILPSIRGRRVYVPLRFWFNENYGSAFPLIAVQYDSEPTVVLTLRPLLELYTIIDTITGFRVKPNPTTNPTQNIGYYLSYGSTTPANGLDIIPNMDINYIFLDRDERKRFALAEHEYLIKQIQLVMDQFIPGTLNNNTGTLELKIQHPVSSLYWVLRRSDYEEANQWFNYTNWPIQSKPPYFNTSSYNPFGIDVPITTDNYTAITEKNLVQSGTLLLNGVNRFDNKTWEFFNLTNNYQHQQRIPDDGIYSYSFSVENDNKYQPSGTCNMSRFNKIQLQLELLQSLPNTNYTYRIYVFAVNYNIFRMLGGLGDIEFSS